MNSNQQPSRRMALSAPSSLFVMAGVTLVFWSVAPCPATAQRLLGGNQMIGVAPGQTLSPTVLAQIAALDAEKSTRTPAQLKIDSQLLYTLKMSRHQAIARGIMTLETTVTPDQTGRVLVDIDAHVTMFTLKQITRMGGIHINNFAPQNAIRASVPLAQIEAIAALPGVTFVHPAHQWHTVGKKMSLSREWQARHNPAFPFPGSVLFAPTLPREAQIRAALPSLLRQARQARPQTLIGALMALPSSWDSYGLLVPSAMSAMGTYSEMGGGDKLIFGAGSVDSEGDTTHRANLARSMFGADGTGIRIGVISDGVDSQSASLASGDISPLTVISGQAGSGDEGTAMLEIVHDLAPGATLYFATADGGPSQLAANIRALRAAGCDIIVDDVEYQNEPPFQDGPIALAVNDVVGQGALYFSSAGNSGNKDDNTASVWQGDFVDGGAATLETASGTGARLHSFGAQTLNKATTSGTISTELFWSDPLGASTNDYDLYILNAAGTAVSSSSTNVQSGTQDPYETVNARNGRQLVIVKHAGAAARFLYLGMDANDGVSVLSISTTGHTKGHNSTTGGFGVAATPVRGPYPNAFSSANVVETFSSDGPRLKFFNPDGSAITPGNFSSTGGAVLNKPDFTAADGVSTSLPAFTPFFGTSAAAPHAAAIAGLLKSYNSNLTLAQVQAALGGTATDIMAAGYDRDSGAGILDAVNVLGSVQPAALTSVNTSVSSVSGGRTIQGSVTLANAAPAGGAVVTLSANPSGLVTLPSSVTVAAGQQTATFSIAVSVVTSSVTVNITANYAGVTRFTPLNLLASYLLSGVTTTQDGAAVSGVTLTASGLGTTALPAQTTTPNIPIPDGSGTTSPVGGGAVSASINVTAAGTVQSLKVGVGITHTYRGDLQVILIAPDGTQVALKNTDETDSTANLNTSYPDLTPSAGDLSVLVGKSITGTWQLTAQDFYAGDTGTLNSFTLTLTASNTPVTLTATSDNNGAFGFPNQGPATFTLTPTKPGFSFIPAPRSVTIGPDQTAQNFTLSQTSIRTTATAAFVNNEYQVTVTCANNASVAASAAQITRAILGSASAPTAPTLPATLGSIASGSANNVLLHFPLSAGAHGSNVLLRVSGNSTQGAFGGSLQITLP